MPVLPRQNHTGLLLPTFEPACCESWHCRNQVLVLVALMLAGSAVLLHAEVVQAEAMHAETGPCCQWKAQGQMGTSHLQQPSLLPVDLVP